MLGDPLTVDSRRWFWPLDGEIGHDGNLWIFVAEMSNPNGTGAGPGTVPDGTWLARLDPDSLEVLSFERAPNDGLDLYGWSVVSDDRYSYLFGHCYRQFVHDVNGPGQFDSRCMPHTYLARVPLGHFEATPEYWTAAGWGTDASAAVPVSSRGAANPMSVQWFGDVFVSVTKADDWWGTVLYVDRASSPQGPWQTVQTIPVVGDRKCQNGCGNYGAFLLPWRQADGKMVVALSNGGEFALWRANASIYRPTFYALDVPGRLGAGSASPPRFTLPTGPSAGFVAVDPVRLADTRRPGAPMAAFTAGAERRLDVTAIAPPGAVAVALNLTTTGSTADGWVRAYPCSDPEPPTSNVNPVRGAVVTNAAIVPLGTGTLCFRSEGATDLIVDLNGWLTTASDVGLVPVTARRVVDTRTGVGGLARLSPGQPVAVAVTADPGTTAVTLNLTAVDPGADGYVTAWPCGGPAPEVSNLNPRTGVTRPNLVTVRVGSGGRVCFVSLGATDLLVDLLGEFRPGAGSRYTPLTPQRILDTRLENDPTHPSNLSRVLPFGTVTQAQLNLTATGPRAEGYLTAYTCLKDPWPGTSNVNFGAGETAANAALLGASRGYGCVFSSVATELVVDVFGVWR